VFFEGLVSFSSGPVTNFSQALKPGCQKLLNGWRIGFRLFPVTKTNGTGFAGFSGQFRIFFCF